MAKERIDKIFSQLGLLSRSECKRAVKSGLISVNGNVCRAADEKADPDIDAICYRGEAVDTRSLVYYMLNKPSGCITANEDKNAATVFDYIDDRRTDLSAVGRLDKDTTGILIITNDGDINHRLLSPKYHVPKCYEALVAGVPSAEDIALLERGLDIGDEKPTLPAQCRILEVYAENVRGENADAIEDHGPTALVELIITEGRFHQVKRMFEAIEKPVIKLHRSSFGPLELDANLRPGEYRELSKAELDLLNEASGRD